MISPRVKLAIAAGVVLGLGALVYWWYTRRRDEAVVADLAISEGPAESRPARRTAFVRGEDRPTAELTLRALERRYVALSAYGVRYAVELGNTIRQAQAILRLYPNLRTTLRNV